MHKIQEQLLALATKKNLGKMSLREIGALINVPAPQKVKHHLEQLEKKGLLSGRQGSGVLTKVKSGLDKASRMISLPIIGSANCGPATIYAEANIEGYLKISPRLLPKGKNIFAIQAVGYSMNRANINGRTIDNGDYVIIDADYKIPKNNDYVLSVIDGVANIKKFIKDVRNKMVILVSESTRSYPPIYIHKDDLLNYLVSGRAVQVIKHPKLNLALTSAF